MKTYVLLIGLIQWKGVWHIGRVLGSRILKKSSILIRRCDFTESHDTIQLNYSEGSVPLCHATVMLGFRRTTVELARNPLVPYW
jgi:hypothetical protein